MLDGEIEYHRSYYTSALNSLLIAIESEDGLRYAELWGWKLHTWHPYASLSLEQGLVEQGVQAYAEDLGFGAFLTRARRHPHNI